MKSYSERPRSVRATRAESTDAKRQRGEDGKRRAETTEKTTDVIVQIRTGLSRIEGRLDKFVHDIEDKMLKERGKEASKEEKVIVSDMGELFADLKRIEAKVAKHTEVDEKFLRRYAQQSTERKKLEKILEEVRMERDVLLEKVHTYLEQISSLKSKVEEQRCSVGAYERQVNAEYEIHLRKLESMNEDLRIVAMQKDKQLKDANEQLRQMQKTLRSYEMLSWRKKNEESVFISILKNDLQTIWNDKIKMEEEFKRLKKQCGYMDDDNRWRVSSEEYVGSLLRRSKSMSDLTLEINSDADDCRKASTTTPNTPSRNSKVSPAERPTTSAPIKTEPSSLQISQGETSVETLVCSSKVALTMSKPLNSTVEVEEENGTEKDKSVTLTDLENVTKTLTK